MEGHGARTASPLGRTIAHPPSNGCRVCRGSRRQASTRGLQLLQKPVERRPGQTQVRSRASRAMHVISELQNVVPATSPIVVAILNGIGQQRGPSVNGADLSQGPPVGRTIPEASEANRRLDLNRLV